MAGIQKRRQKATRYFTEDDDDDGGATAAATSTMPPAMCAVFKTLDPDEHESAEIEAANQVREKVIGKLRALNLNVDQFNSSDNKFIFVTIGAPETMLKYEAEHQRAKLRLREEYGGALCYYLGELDEKKAYDKPLDGFELFSSTLQLKLIDEVVRSKPYGSNEKDEPIDFDELMADGKVEEYFPLHHSRMRMKLVLEWASLMTKPQPLEMVREYFGEQIALFYTWYGFYNTMLWIPALCGLVLFCSQMYTYSSMSGSLENPFILVYGIVLSLWASCFCQLWMALENTRKHEWDTLDFENDEKVREEFMESNEVIRDEVLNDVTGDPEEYYYPDGSWLPPTGRARKQLITYVVIGLVNAISIFVSFFIWADMSRPLMEPGNVIMGGIIGGVASAAVSIIIDSLMDGVPELEHKGIMAVLVEGELWKTDTEHQDNIILKTFYFKLVTKYFGLTLVAFAVNLTPVMGEDRPCPDWQCMPVLQVMYVTIIVCELLYSLFQSQGIPALKKAISNLSVVPDKVGGPKVAKSPIEDQFEWFDPSPVIEMYKDKVYQFGYIVLFAAAFPIVPMLCLVSNTFDLRQRAMTLLTKNKRPEPFVAADIGTYQTILEILATLAIISNSLLIGLTSHGLYFYIPDLTQIDRIWAVVVLEHFLLLMKIVIGAVIPTEPAKAILTYSVQQERKDQQLALWDVAFEEE
mmetsp:Transcript_45788/g.110217  ORF Transcript_45788/g.110217 Transcript_45788/m.110217 type:complete len:693 (+) Transcript_45788:62-2140(+)